MLLTNWLNTLTSRIRKRRVFRSRDRRDIRKRWQSIVHNQISTTEALEDRTLLTTFFVDDDFDGSTPDFGDTHFDTIQAAVTAAASSGDLSDIIHIADGTYNENVTVGTSIEFIGAGTAATTVTGSGNLFTVTADDVKFQDMQLQGATQGIRVDLLGGTVDNLQVDNVHFIDISSYGIEVHNGTTLTNLDVANSLFRGTASVGIRFAQSAIGDGVDIDNTEFDGLGRAIYQQSQSATGLGYLADLQLTNSTIHNMSSEGVYVEELTGDNITGTNISNNIFEDNSRDIILNNKYGTSGTAFGNIFITDNTFTDSEKLSIQLNSKGTSLEAGVTITGNTFNSAIESLIQNWGQIDVSLQSGFSHAPVVINENTINFTGSSSAATEAYGIRLMGASDDITINGNTLTNTNTGITTSALFVDTNNADMGPISSTAIINATNNFISGFDSAVSVIATSGPMSGPGGLVPGAQLNVNNNSITNNAIGVLNGPGATVNASGNWWGISDEGVIAALMTVGVDFSSYLNSGTDTDGGTAGFQGDFSVVNVTALGAQTGPVGRIQEAINLATSGATINIAAGTYAEDVIVNTSVIIQGANAGIAAGVDPGVRGLESELTGGFSLFANDVVIDGLKIVEGTGPAGVGDKTAVFMTAGTTGHTIENNILVGPGIGVASRAVLSTFNGNNDNITIQNNEIYNWFGGIFNQGNTNVDVFGNNFHNMFAGVSNDFVTDVSIEGNAFSHLVEGVGVFNNISNGIPDVAAHNNSFDSVTLINPIAHYGGDTVDASGNWWGITDETQIANSMMSNGVDGNVSKIDFTSFLNDGADTVVGLAGFQGNFSVVNVTTLGEQTGLTGRIQEAIDSVAYGATINILAGTYTGNVDATGINITLAPGNSPGQVVINGDLILNGDDTLDIEINGTTAGSGFDQFVVNGDVTLNGATLNLIDGYTPDVAESFILIENDGPNPVTGTFNGYPEGYEFTDFLGVGGLSAFLTYAGGDGNDVAIYTEVPAPVVTIPDDGADDEYTLQIVGGNVVITEVGSGNVISNTPMAALGGTLVINGEDGQDDTLTIDMTGIDETTDLKIIFNGGTGGFDTLELVNGNLDSMEFRYVDPSSGSIRLNGSGSDFISYTGLEPVTSTINATNVTLTYTGGAEIIDISDLGGGQTRVNSSLGEMTDFFNPTGTLTINAGTGADTININSLAAGYTANIIINGGDETDTINVDSSVSLAAGKTIQFNAEVVELTGDVTADAITGTAATVNITGSAGGAEIQDAIDLAASGATINIAAGAYNENVNVNKSVTLDGVGTADTIIDNSGVLFTVAADDVRFQDMTLQNASQGIRTYLPAGTIDNLQVNNVHFVDMSSRGIEIHNDTTMTNMSVADSLFQDTGVGIRLSSSAVGNGIDITTSIFDGGTLGFYQSNDGSTGNVRDLQISGTTFRNFTDTAVFAEEIRDSAIDDNIFEDNRRDFTLFKAYTTAGTPVENLQIINNEMTNSAQTAVIIYVTGSGLGSGIDISNNTITSDVGLLLDERGKIDIYLEATESHSPINITENSITFSGTFAAAEAVYGIKVRGGSDSINIERNTLDGGGVGSNGGTPLTSGIYVRTNDAGMGAISSSAVINVLNNFITGFDAAVSVHDQVSGQFGGLTAGAQLNVNNNSIAGNAAGITSGTGGLVNASNNWWGPETETTIAGLMTGGVDFTSYLDNGTDTDGGTAGFQGNFNVVNVTALGEQTGPAGRIEEALQAVAPGGTVKINSGTYTGNVDATVTGVNKNVTLAPGNSPGQVVINGDLILNGDDFLDIEINGQTAGSGYDQFIVNGAVVLNDAALNLTNTYTPVDGDKFTLIDNDAADGITGEFIGFPEGHEFTNFLGSGLNAYLTYVGGNGNDVVIHMEDSTPEVTLPANGTTDHYSLEIDGTNVVIKDVATGDIISSTPLASLEGTLVINGEDGQNDTLSIDMTGIDDTTPLQIQFNGGTGGFDTLELLGGSLNSVEHIFTSDSSGSVQLNGSGTDFIRYTGLEPVLDTIVAGDRTFSFTGAAEIITLSDDGVAANGTSRIDSDLFGEVVTFLNPTDNIFINTEVSGGSGADLVDIVGLDSDFDANLTVTAGTDDTINTGTVDIGSGALDLTGGQVNVNGAFTTTGSVDIVSTFGNITFASAGSIDAGTSEIDLTAASNVNSLNVTTTSEVRVTATTGGINDLTLNAQITADRVALRAGTGGITGITTNVNTLAARATDGGFDIDNIGSLEIGSVNGLDGITANSSQIYVTATGALTVNQAVSAETIGYLRAVDAASAGQDLNVNAGVTTTSGNLNLQAGDNLNLATGVTLNAAAALILNIDSPFGGVADAAGGVANLNGILQAGTDITVNGGTQADQVIIDSNGGPSNDGGTVDGIQSLFTFVGGGGSDELIVDDSGDNTGDNIIIQNTAPGVGAVIGAGAVTLSYEDLEDLTVYSGSDADDITVNPNISTAINIIGGNPTTSPGDSLTYLTPFGEGSTYTPTGADSGTIAATGGFQTVTFDEIETVTLGGSVTVTGTAADDVLTITATSANAGTYQIVSGGVPGPVVNINSITDFTFNGGDGDDVLIIDNSGIAPTAGSDLFNPVDGIFFNGQGNTVVGDSLQILGGDATTVEHRFTNNNDGSIHIDGSPTATITYTGLEPIQDDITATDRIFSFLGGAETITLSDDGDVGDGESTIDSDLAESVTFAHPSGTVTINTEAFGGSGVDLVQINAVDSTFTANLTVNAGNDDTLTTTTVDIGAGDADLNAGQVNVNGTFTTTGTVDIDAGTQITFAAAGIIDAGANTIDLTAGSDIQLGLITTSGNVTVEATAGAITDANAAVNNINATNATLVSGTGTGVGDALETTITALEANIGAGLELDNTGALNIGFAGGINGVTVGAPSTITSTGTMTVTENITATGGSLQLQNTGGDFLLNALAIISNNSTFEIGIDSAGAVMLADTSTVTSSGTGLVDIDAVNNIALANVTTSGEVQVTTSAGAITDNTASEAALITANTAALRAATGIGVAGAGDIDLAVGTVSADTSAGDIFLESAAGFAVGTVDTLAGITALGNISLVTGGTLTINNIIEATGAAATILVDAQGNIDVNSTVETNGGAIDLLADNNLNLNAASVVDTNSAAVVTLTADSDTTGGGSFTQTEGSLVNAQGGALNVTATGNVRLADLRSASGTISVTSTNQGILDNTAGEAALISGGAGTEVELRAATNIGTGISGGANDIDLAVSRVAAVATTGNIVLINTGALELGTVNGLVGLDAGDRVLVTTASPLTVASNVTGAGNVTLTSTDAGGAGDNLTINGGGVLVESTGADVILNSGDDFLLTAGGTVRASTTIEINVDPITDGTGATVDLLGNVDATQTTINGGDDADTFNILPTDDSPITVNGGLPTFPGPGDVLNMDFSAISNPLLTLGAAPGSGTFDFPSDTEQTVDYTGIENVNTSTGGYHLVLNMFTSGFQNTVADTIDATVDATDTDLLLDINGGNFFTGAVADILSFTTIGSTDNETLNINENANGVLPFFQGAAPATIPGSNGSHLNASAQTFLNAEFAGAAPFTVDDITIHYDGGLGTDTLNVNFTSDHNTGYFSDTDDGLGSGNIGAATTAGADIDLGLSFARLEGVGINGTATGGLRVDASSTPLTDNITISDDGTPADGISLIDGNMQFTDLLFSGFDDLQVVSGTGAETLDLIGLDSATTLTDVELDADDVNGTDTGNDTIRVRSTPVGTVTNVTVRGGLGNDLIQIFDAGNTVDNIFAAIAVFGEDGTDTLTLDDSGDVTGDDTFEVTSTTIEGISSSPGTDVTFTDIDNLNVTGTAGNDTINVNLGASLDLNNVEINGSGGDDTFNLQNSTPAGVDTRLNGDAGLDDFIFLASNVLTGVIDGGADVDTIDYSSYTPAVHVILNAVGTTDGFRGTESTSILETVLSTGFDNIDNLIGSAGVDTLQGPDLSNYWGITSTDEGFIIADRTNLNSGRPTVAGDAIASGAEERLDFTSFQNLIGGSQDDRFDLSDGAGLTGTLDGDSGNDSLDYRDFTTDVTVNLFAGTATNIGSLLAGAGGGDDDNSIENVFGGNGNDNITGDNDNNILGDGLGSDNLDGGGFGAGGGIGAGGSGNGGNDVFLLEPGNAGSADVITDIHGNDTVDFRFASAGITFDVDIINEAQTVFGTSTVELRQIQPEQPDTNPSFMENVVGSQQDDYIYIDPLSQDGNFPIDGPPVLRSADGQGGTDFLDFDSKGQEVIDTGFSLTADGVGTVQYLNFENVTPFEDNPAFIIDNGDPGFTFTGDWPWFTLSNTYLTTGAGFEDDFYVTDAETPFSTGPAQAYWEFFGLTPGEYRVSVTWPFSENPSAAQFKATDAPFTVFDGTRDEIGSTAIDHGTFDLNQQLEPDDYSADGTTWEILDTFTISSRTLTVMLTNLADGYITADAIRIERVSAGPEIDLLDVTDALEPPAQIVDGNPDGIQFGPTELLTNAVRTFEITNSGSSDLTISNVLVPAGYETTLTDQVIGSGNTVSFTITMGSDTFGDRSGIFSFETDDVDESTFNILLDGQVSNVIIIDDGDADFSATPGFINFPTLENLGSNGYEGDVTGAVPNDPGYTPAPGLETATWTFSGLTNGNYRVSTTWSQYFNRVEDAPYSLNGGSIIEVDQSVAPSSFVEDGVAWFDLSTSFNVTTGELVVTLTNEASSWVRDHWDLANGVIADAVRIEYLPVPDIEITVDGSPVDDDTGVVDFGSTLPGIPVIKEFTITNLSTTDAVDVTGLIEFPPGFSILPTSPFGTDTATVPLAAGASITFSIQFDGGTNGTTFGKVSFTTGDADENPYNFTVRGEAGPATVGINDTNFSTSGTWQEVNPENIGDPLFLYANELYQPGTGANAATWSFDVEPGRYQVVAHWNVDPGVTMNGSGAASNAPYTISDGVSPVTVYVNQQTSSNDFLDDGILWEYIGDPFVVSDPSSTLTVQLTDDADGIVYADQIRIYRVVDPVVKVEVDGGTVEDSGTVNFDDTIVGASVVKTFTVTNYGERNMALSPTINFPAGFSLISGFGSTNLAPGASTTFTLQMDASSAGSFEGMVSFGVDSSDANPFNFTVTGSAANSMIIDNGDLGYTTSGNWIPQSSTTIYDYYEDDQDVLASDNLPSTDTATWDFTNLAAGTYSISSHWGSHSNLSSNAQFLISGILGGDITVSLDQRYAADDFVDGSGVNWEALGTFQVAGGSDLTITLLDNGTPGRLAADAMRLEVLLPGTIDPEIEIEAGAVSLVDSVSNIDLGTAFYGETLSQTFTITNTGTDTLNLSSVTLTNGSVFGVPVLPDFTIYAGQSTTFTVEFNSTGTAGPETSLLTINSNDSDEGSFEIDLSATMTTTLIIDDGDTGFSSTGDFFATSWLAYYEWDAHQLNTGDTGTATWEFSGLNPGDNFNVYATWSAHGSLATNAEYSINAGGPIVVNQRLAPNDLNSDGANWELLGTVNVTAGGLISVTLSENAADGRIRADAIRIERTGPLMAAAGVSTSNAPAITQSDLDSVRDAALSYWKSTGLSETQISLLESVSFVLADLPDAMLGAATTTTILIDVNAAGYGWFVDDTPFDNSEFSLDASGELVAGTGSAAYGQMDLLTVMLHEMGHTLGYDHDDDGDSLMSDALDASERHLPEIDDFFSGVADGDNPLLD
ncbi:choice-of-anchor D domain-containing protein [Gimesia maris]|uniref:golvesin C-terminal-like domain-containing protein n=1 Tax=Gimesia maris TaxID=122 RepID=UPI0030D8FF12|tara:strand:- start:128615 stop:145582 length:16968 start_codon:yes stop_codon:yes gene_type:complete